jgi:hypothetical protein
MAFTFKDGQGSMFLNEKENDRQPDWNGQGILNGVPVWIAGWEKESQKGQRFISLNFTPKNKNTNQSPDNKPAKPKQKSTPPPPPFGAPEEDDIPF